MMEGRNNMYLVSGDRTDFLSRNGRVHNCQSFSNVLMFTTMVGMVYRVHSHTISTGPAAVNMSGIVYQQPEKPVCTCDLGLEFVVDTTSFKQRLIDMSNTSNNTNRGMCCA
jgi:hypothetical protein